MKRLILLILSLVVFSCSSTRMVDSWKNTTYKNFEPKKVLVVGITDNLTARMIFEERLKHALETRNINAVESYDEFEHRFISNKQTQENIDSVVKDLSDKKFDAILISALKGVDEKTSYSGDQYSREHYWRRFGPYYFLHQDVYFKQGYYDKYNVYHIEASLYDLKTEKDKSLVWVASYNIVDPINITDTVDDYVKAIITNLEKEGLISEVN